VEKWRGLVPLQKGDMADTKKPPVKTKEELFRIAHNLDISKDDAIKAFREHGITKAFDSRDWDRYIKVLTQLKHLRDMRNMHDWTEHKWGPCPVCGEVREADPTPRKFQIRLRREGEPWLCGGSKRHHYIWITHLVSGTPLEKLLQAVTPTPLLKEKST